MIYHPVNPKSDIFVRYLFGSLGHESMLKSFINAVNRNKGRPELKEVQIVNPFNLKTNPIDKESCVDVKAMAHDGSLYDIEVQILNKGNFPERTAYYWARLYVDQLKEGNDYDLLKQVICINVINFNLPFKHPELHSSYGILERNEHDELTDHLVIDFLELPRLGKNSKIDNELLEWLNFFATEEGKKAMLDYNSPKVQEAVRAYQNFINDPELHEAYEAHLKFNLDWNSSMSYSYKEGMAAGIEQGIERGVSQGARNNAMDNARKMLADGMPIELVSKYTSLTQEEIQSLIS